jgi:hypothetical protein
MDVMSLQDPWNERLSEYLDGELGPAERAACEAHLAGCASCRALLDDLARLQRAARALPARPPERDLWPGIERALGRGAPRTAWLLAFAAGVLVTLGALLAYRLVAGGRAEPELVARGGEDYMLLLHEPAGFGEGAEAEHAAIVERYARWAAELGERCTGGEELAPEGLELRPGSDAPGALPDGARVGGYFLLSVRDREEALALARTCPHLEQGGWIELRRIRTR